MRQSLSLALSLAQYPQYSKLSGPKLSRVIIRQRLFRMLDRSRKGQVIWITGPPGSGKTTLVASYIKGRGLPGIWYQIDGRDADPATFFYYLKLAADRSAKRRHPALPLLGPEYQVALPAFAARYFGNLFERFTSPFAVVFDDYHNLAPNLSDNQLIHDMINEGMERVPERGVIIVISRGEPWPAFARIRESGRLTVIGWEDLKFTEKETGSFARLYTGKGLPRQTVRAMHDRTAGWAAGMALMMEYIEHTPVSLDRAEHSFSLMEREAQETIFSYFEGEVFDRADDGMREFLLTSAFLPRMTPEAVEALTGAKDAGRLLSKLVRSSSFISRYHAREPFYQYHALFLDFLRAKAIDLWSADALGRARRRAAKALSDTGQTEDAIALYLQASDWTQAARLIIAEAPGLIDTGRFRTLEAWLLGLPSDVLDRDPWLLYWLGASRVMSDPAGSLESLDKAYHKFKEDNVPAGMYVAIATTMKAFILSTHDVTSWGRWVKEFKELHSTYPAFPSREIELEASFGIYSALLFHDPQDPELPMWAEKVKSILTKIPDRFARIRHGSMLFLYYSWTGDFFNAGVLADMFHALVRSGDTPLPTRLLGYVMECTYLWNRGSTDACLREMEEALAIAHADTIHIVDRFLLGAGLHASLINGDVKTAAGIVKRMEDAVNPFYRFALSNYHFLLGWYRILAGDPPGAHNYAEEGLALAQQAGVPYVQAHHHLELAYLCIGDGRYREASSHLAHAHSIAVGMKSMQLEYHCLMTRAWYDFTRGRETQALKGLAQALAIGKRQGFAVTLVFHRSALADLYNRALDAGIETDYVKGVIRKLDLAPPALPDHNPAAAAGWPWPIAIFTLGRFELMRDGEKLVFSGKVQKKPLTLLKAISAFGGEEVEVGQLADLLWPDSEGDIAFKALRVTLIRLRRLLGYPAAVRLVNGKVSLDPRYCRVDAWAFEQALDGIGAAAQEAGGPGKERMLTAQMQQTVASYSGDFLAGESYPWSISYRERLRLRFTGSIESLGNRLEQGNAFNKAIEVYHRGLEADELSEVCYQRIIACYLRTGRHAEALSTYHTCKKTLAVYGIEPSSETEALYRQIKTKNSSNP